MAMRLLWCLCVYGVTAQADEVTSQPAKVLTASTPVIANSSPADTQLGEVVVTANRREESLQRIPLTATVANSAALDNLHITNLQDVENITPSLMIQPAASGPTQVIYTMRGQTQIAATQGLDPAIAAYMDDVYLGRSMSAVNNLVDIARVEVLEGPQGSLYGRNTTGGAVKIITEKPVLGTFEGFVSGGYSNGVSHKGALSNEDFVLNVPIGDKAALRLVGQNSNRQGYFINQETGHRIDFDDTDSIRGSFLWKPDDRLSILFGGDYVTDTTGASPTTLGAYTPTLATEVALQQGLPQSTFLAVVTGAATAAQSAQFGAAYGRAATTVNNLIAREQSDPYNSLSQNYSTQTGRVDPRATSTAHGLSLNIIYDFDDFTLRSITAYRDQNQPTLYDVNGGLPYDLVTILENYGNDQISQEFLFNGTALSDRLKWTGGLFYYSELGHARDQFDAFPLLEATFGSGAQSYDVHVRNQSDAAYGQLAYELPHNLTLTAGGRYTVDHRKAYGNSYAFFTDGASACTVPNLALGAPCYASYSASFNRFTYDVSLQWQFEPNKQVYLRYGTGFRSGGVVGRFPNQGEPFQPELNATIEGGFKGGWFANRLTTNVSTYYARESNIQQSITASLPLHVIDSTGATRTFNDTDSLTFNTGSERIYGVESQVAARPTERLTLSAFYAYQTGTYQDAAFSNSFISIAGFYPSTRPPDLPRNTAGVSVDYVWPKIASSAEPTLHADYYYRSNYLFPAYTGAFLESNLPQSGDERLLNANLALKFRHGIVVSLFAKNILGKIYYSRIASAGFTTFNTVADPATVGLTVKIPFGALADERRESAQ
jgi:iron complex outermembrane receptor protein